MAFIFSNYKCSFYLCNIPYLTGIFLTLLWLHQKKALDFIGFLVLSFHLSH